MNILMVIQMVKIFKDGKEYEVGRNYIVGESIKGDKVGYKLAHKTDGFTSTIYFISNNFFHDKQPKNIGELHYDFTTDIITYKKFIKQQEHEFHKTDSIGLNWDIVSNLCPKDRIVIIETSNKTRFVRTISVSKALKFQDFKYFKNLGYEKQLFIPKSEFLTKELEVSAKRKRGAKGGRTNKTRKTSS